MDSCTQHDVRLDAADGVALAVTLYRPVSEHQAPALIEAMAYCKDDVLERAHYRRLASKFGFAVCRVDLRGTGSSSGDATDEYPPEELDDLNDVIDWAATQLWSTGAVGMFGWSYSGFNAVKPPHGLWFTPPPAVGRRRRRLAQRDGAATSRDLRDRPQHVPADGPSATRPRHARRTTLEHRDSRKSAKFARNHLDLERDVLARTTTCRTEHGLAMAQHPWLSVP